MNARSVLRVAAVALLMLAACKKKHGEEPFVSFLFYGDGGSASDLSGLRAVDPAHPGTPVVIEASDVALSRLALVQAGHWDGGAGTLTGLHTRYVLYAKDAGDGDVSIFRVSARASQTAPAPAQVGALRVPPANLCGVSVFTDWKDPSATAVIATTEDDGCGGADPQVQTLFRLSDGATAAGTALPDGVVNPTAVRSRQSGAIVGWLLQTSAALVYRPLDLDPAQETTVSEGGANIMAEAAGRIWMAVGGNLAFFDVATLALRSPPGDPVPFVDGSVWWSDGQALYWAPPGAGATIQSIPLDGSAGPANVHTVGDSESVGRLRTSAHRVLYVEGTTSFDWMSVPKAGGDAVQVHAGNGSSPAARLDVAGERLYFADTPPTTSVSIVAEDGSDPVTPTVAGTSYFNVVGGDEMPIGGRQFDFPRYLVLFDEGATGGVSAQSYDGPAGTPLAALGTFPTGQNNPETMVEASGTSTLLLSTGSPNQLFVTDVATAGSMTQLEATNPSAQHYVGTSGCQSGGAGGIWAGVLAALSLLALRRRTRRAR